MSCVHIFVDHIRSHKSREAPLPGNESSTSPGENGGLASVSYSGSTSCTAVGGYIDPIGDDQGLIETLSNGTWSASEAPKRENESNSPNDNCLASISCSAADTCPAVGAYTVTGGGEQGLIETKG